ncbi:peptidoglycan-associated lipoprotein Pal [Sphingomonas sp. ASV193]|uniref:peptidoglycan-associated lipoprotein Pal n=1 Tax=Sphingomonas sp. ASV193 TaxID=3144405 RepID=UPI0032E8D844
MTKSFLIGFTALALTLGACGQKAPPPPVAPPLPPAPVVDPNSTDPNSLETTLLPAMQADMVAKAGSDTVYFGTDEYTLDMPARTTLAAQARWLIAHPQVRASLEGHCDVRGTREYNQALGERRANSVREFMLSQGVPAAQLVVTSWGKEKPVATGSNESAWAQNRREVTVIIR